MSNICHMTNNKCCRGETMFEMRAPNNDITMSQIIFATAGIFDFWP
jgi:hypothetical protein